VRYDPYIWAVRRQTVNYKFSSLSSRNRVMLTDIQKIFLFSVVTKKRDIIANRCEMVERCSIQDGDEKYMKC
jgi:hypothetical protein